MNNNEIKNVVNSLSKLIDDNEKVALKVFANKLSSASLEYPEDYTIGIRGLRKSKEKEQPQTTSAFSSKNELRPITGMFNPPKPRRDLPPVLADQKLMNKHQTRRTVPREQYLHSSEEEEE